MRAWISTLLQLYDLIKNFRHMHRFCLCCEYGENLGVCVVRNTMMYVHKLFQTFQLDLCKWGIISLFMLSQWTDDIIMSWLYQNDIMFWCNHDIMTSYVCWALVSHRWCCATFAPICQFVPIFVHIYYHLLPYFGYHFLISKLAHSFHVEKNT